MKIVVDMQGIQSANANSSSKLKAIQMLRLLIKSSPAKDIIILAFSGQLESGLRHALDNLRDIISPSQCRCWHAPTPFYSKDKNNSGKRAVATAIYNEFLLSLNPDIILVSLFTDNPEENLILDFSANLKSKCPITAIVESKSLVEDPVAKQTYNEEWNFPDNALLTLQEFSTIYTFSEENAYLYSNIAIGRCPNQRVEYLTKYVLEPEKIATYLNSNGTSEREENNLFVLAAKSANCPLAEKAIKACEKFYFGNKSHISLALYFSELNEECCAENKLEISSSWRRITSEDSLLHNLTKSRICLLAGEMQGKTDIALKAVQTGSICLNYTDQKHKQSKDLATCLTNSIEDVLDELLLEQAWSYRSFRKSIIKKQQLISFEYKNEEVGLKLIRSLFLAQKRYKATTRPEAPLYDVNDVAARLRVLCSATNADPTRVCNSIINTFEIRDRKKRVYLDISQLIKQDHKTGIQRVVRSLLTNIKNLLPNDWEAVPTYSKGTAEGYFVASTTSTSTLSEIPEDLASNSPAVFKPGDILLILDLDHLAAIRQKKLLQSIRARGIYVFFIVYDILPIKFPHFFENSDYLESVHKEWLKIISDSDGFFAISKSVYQETKRWLQSNLQIRHPSYTYGYFRLGADIKSSAPTLGGSKEEKKTIELVKAGTSFVQVSTIEPRKAPAEILDAFEQLWEMGYDINLVYVGKEGWLVDKFIKRLRNHKELGRHLFWLCGISDQMLEDVYEGSTCCIMASYGEGFGLPIVEAANHGLPIIARDIPVFREIGGENVHFFDTTKGTDLASSIIEWLNLYENGEHPKSEYLQINTWQMSANELIKKLLSAVPRQQA